MTDEQTTTTSESGNKMNPMIIVAAVALLLLVGVGVLMMGKNNSTTTPSTSDSADTQDSVDAMTGSETAPTTDENIKDTSDSITEGDVQIINLEAGSFYYKPNTITVKKGQTVRIVMNSVDMMHDFNIDELGVKIPVTKSGETAEVEFTADQVGSFEYYCSVGQHRANGQVGTITVEE